MRPLFDRVILKLIPESKETDSGIILPEQKALKGEVISVALTTEAHTPKLKIGDVVIYHPNAGKPIDYNGDKCLIISQEQCIAVL